MTHLITNNQSLFDSIKRIDDTGIEFWFARELQPLLGYQKWQSFQGVIESAITCMNNSNIDASNHIILASNIVTIGSGSERDIIDYSLSRLGAYIVTINGDPRKTEIALAQAYFASMTIFAEQTTSKSTKTQSETELFSEKNLELATQIAEKARGFIRENIALKAENLQLKQQIGKLDVPKLPPSEGMRVKQLLRCCGVTINSTDPSLFSRVALDIRRAVETGELPRTAIANRGRYRYSPSVELWLKNWLFRYERLNQPIPF